MSLEKKLRAYKAALSLLAADDAFVTMEGVSPFFKNEELGLDEDGRAFCCTYVEWLDEENRVPVIWINCGDTFAFACADAEPLNNLDDIIEVAELRWDKGWIAVIEWIAKRRQEKGDPMRYPIRYKKELPHLQREPEPAPAPKTVWRRLKDWLDA